MPRPNDKKKIIEHYDVVSPYYHQLWGEHLHHGYWVRGDESKDEAQRQLIEYLARKAGIPRNSEILDIGCGFGATSLYLAKHFGAKATGITISSVQVEMANKAAAKEQADTQFLLMDAEAMTFTKPFDVLWSVESISHYHDLKMFFASAVNLLKPGGVFALTDWFRRENMTLSERKKYIEPIDYGMFVELREMEEYAAILRANGMEIVHLENLNKFCAKTWELSLDIIKDKAFWGIAAKFGTDFVRYLRSFQVVRAGFASGNFIYGLLVARKP
jgi:tocopherol O-methyltransferase